MKSSPYFLLSFLLLMIGEFLCFIGILKTSKKILTFISGVSFILSGIFWSYPSFEDIESRSSHTYWNHQLHLSVQSRGRLQIVCKVRIMHQLQGWINFSFRSVLAPPVFSYTYGYSFIILLMSFLLTEVTGELAKEYLNILNCAL